MSDHKIATFFLDIELTKRGSGYWKINNSILNDIDYIKMIKRVINDFLITNTQEYTSPHILWETFKMCNSNINILIEMEYEKRRGHASTNNIQYVAVVL